MACLLKDESYQKRRDTFTEKLLVYHRMNGNPLRRFPLLGGRELDLYHLYTKVQLLGGSDKVTRERMWGEVARSFNLPNTVTSASYACRQNYLKFLAGYEELELRGTPFDPSTYKPTHRPTPRSRPAPIKLSYTSAPTLTPPPSLINHIFSNPPNKSNHFSSNSLSTVLSQLPNLLSLPSMQGLGNLLDQLSKSPNQLQVLSNLLHLPPNQIQLLQLLVHQHQLLQQSRILEMARYDWLTRSLQCGYPNEVDFALNSLLIISSDNQGVLPLRNVPHLVDVMLAHVGVFSKDDPYLEVLYNKEWHISDNQDYHMFWEEITPEWVYLSALERTSLCVSEFRVLFPNKSVMSHDCVESVRVTHVAMVIRNLSFDETNAEFLASHEGTVRFLLLAMNSKLPLIKSYALDTLSNISPYLLITHEDNDVTNLILASLHLCILSRDRLSVIRGIECLGQLTSSYHNEIPLSQTHNDVYILMIQLLLIPDYQLVITSLDALYNLSFYGGKIGESILHVKHSVDIIIGLLSLNAEHFNNPEVSLKLIHPNGREEDLSLTNQISESVISETETVKNVTKMSPKITSSSTNEIQSSSTNEIQSSLPNEIQSSSTNQIQSSSANEIQSLNHSQAQFDSKLSFGIQWLQSQYESDQEEFISKRDIYSKYLSHCAQLKITNAASQNEFDQIFREAFPNVVFTIVKIAGQDIQLVGGVGHKKVSLPVTMTTSSSYTKSSNSNSLIKDSSSSVLLASLSPSPSPSPPPPPSLSPLQQLIQATKTKNTTGTSKSGVLATPSPLLYSNKMSNLLSSKLVKQVTNKRINEDLGMDVVDFDSANQIKENDEMVVEANKMEERHFDMVQSESEFETSCDIDEKSCDIEEKSCDVNQTSRDNGNKKSCDIGNKSHDIGDKSCDMPAVPHGLTNGDVSSEEDMMFDKDTRTKRLRDYDEEFPVSKRKMAEASYPPVTSHTYHTSPITYTPIRSNHSSSNHLNDSFDKNTTTESLNNVHTKDTYLSNIVEHTYTDNNTSYNSDIDISETDSDERPLDIKNSTSLVSSGNVVSHQCVTKPQLLDSLINSVKNQSNRSSSLPPSLNQTSTQPPKISISSFTSLKPISGVYCDSHTLPAKARSLTPPTDQCSLKLVKPVLATSLTSLPGNLEHSRSESPVSLSSVVEPRLICLWDNCLNIKDSWSDLLYHVMYEHLPSISVYPSPCYWVGCQNKTKRMRPSLLRHIQTHHCSGGSKPSVPNVASTLLKLRAVVPWENEDESNIIKTIRLTATLILRNLLETLPDARQYILPHEVTLSQIAFSNSEASNAAAQCLSLLTTSPFSSSSSTSTSTNET